MREALESGAAAPAAAPEIFLGAGIMAQRMRATDWSRTSLGPPRDWPGALQYGVRMMLAARHPACLWWGADCALLYNDACAPLLGEAHPEALGRPVPAEWLEGPEQLVFVLERHGLRVEVHHALALSSIPGENGGLGGVLCAFSEVTSAVVNERQLALLKELTARIAPASDPRQACRLACEALATGRADLPFSAIYAVDAAESRAEIVAVAGIDFGHPAVPASFALDGQSHWPLLAVLHGRGPQVVTLRAERFGALPTGTWTTPPREAVGVRLAPLDGGATAVLVAALNPHRLFNDDHRRFVDLVASQVAAGITNAQATVPIDNANLFGHAKEENAEAELAATKDELAMQVESLTKLHELTMRLGGMPEIGPALQAILDTAVDAQDADFGLVWLHEPRTGALVVEASRNFSEDSIGFFRRVMPGPAGGSAGNAFAWHCRWVIEDIETDPGFEPFRQGARKAGFKAVHSTPIVTRGGALLGVISVHFARKRRPSQRDMQVADVCVRHAADAIEARRGQEALRESERLYRAIGESIDYGVWICDAKGRNTYVSESFLKLTGLTQEECAENGWGEAQHPDDRERTRDAWERCAATGEQWDVEHRVRGTDGKWNSVLSRGVPVRDEAGSIIAWAGINLDIARLKQVEDELRELDQRKDEFLATLAHELRNPLAPLRNGLEVMRLASANPETVAKARGMMERQLAQMVRLVDDLLDVSRVSRGKIELRREDLELATVLSQALETSQPLMTDRGHQVVATLPPAGVVVNADLTRLAQVFSNLLNNAAKYTEPGGRVELSVRAQGGEVAVSIKDNGVGIPPAMQAQVFDIFTQVDRSLEKSQGGLGIGLSIAKRLVEMHGGSIRVHSEGHRRGTEFVVRLPARVTGPVALAEPDSPVADAEPPRHRVLVADDNPDSATTLSMMLEVMGNEVRTAHDGHEAIAVAEQFRPDAILLDIGMPRMNGYDACERIRSQPWGSNAFIIALTGFGQDEDKERASEAGFDLHLVKPVEPEQLERLIRELPRS